MRLQMLGYWFHDDAPDPWPRPQRLVGDWPAAERAAVLAHLRRGVACAQYLGRSWCRFACGETAMGSCDLTDGVFVWPEGLAHYVDVHSVRLPAAFVRHASAAGDRVPTRAIDDVQYDGQPWLQWGREQGACLDLAGWSVPTRADERRIAAEPAAGGAGRPVLMRLDTREVVFAVPGSGLEIRQLLGDGRPPRRLAGWDEWPVAR